ncbi:MAG TPA: hypothetical protein VN249_01935, partial [Prolixibacteraceae bacterium]|nr:hypothetical protein [Prolixibacteraceae bacterium]
LTIRWNLLTQAVPQKLSNKVIRLTQSNKTLYLLFDGTESVTAKAWSTKPPTSYEEQNTDTYFTGFEYTMAAGATQTVTVRLVPDGDPLLSGMDLSAAGVTLNETFETFSIGSLSSEFVSWKTNPASNGTLRAVLGDVVVNPFKRGINTSEKVLQIKRQDDSEYITAANSGNFTYRGVQAYGYDLKVDRNSVVEFKYYKDAPGKVGVRIYDGNGNVLIVDFTDPEEATQGFSTGQWRTAQFAVGNQDITKFSFTASGYLLISPERNGTEAYQEKGLTMYIDDVKMLPLSITAVETLQKKIGFSAWYDPKTERICVLNLPSDTRRVRLYDLMGRMLQEVTVSGDVAMLEPGKVSTSIYIVQVINAKGYGKSIKVIR